MTEGYGTCGQPTEHFIVFEVYIRTTGIGLFGKFLHQPGFANLAGSKHDQRLSVVACWFFSNFGTFMYLSLRRPLSAKEKSMLFHP